MTERPGPPRATAPRATGNLRVQELRRAVRRAAPSASRRLIFAAACLVGFWWTSAHAADPLAHALDLADHRGKVVVVDFWASWCVPCRQSFPWLNAMHDEYSDDGLVILGVNTDVEAEDAQRFLEEYPAKFAIVYDPAGELARDFGVVAMPSSYVFSRDGGLDTRHFGFLRSKRDEYEAVIRRLITLPDSGGSGE